MLLTTVLMTISTRQALIPLRLLQRLVLLGGSAVPKRGNVAGADSAGVSSASDTRLDVPLDTIAADLGKATGARTWAPVVGGVQEGSEIQLGEGSPAIPCRVAFERGKERAVYLSIAR